MADGNVKSTKSMFVKKTFRGGSYSGWESSGSTNRITSSTNANNTLPDGYTCIGIVYESTGSRYPGIYRIDGSNATTMLSARNYHQSSIDANDATLIMLYARDDLVKKVGFS